MSQKIGFIGLGNMGGPMARNLLKAGYSLVVHDCARARVEELGALGARCVGSPREVAAETEVVITCLPNTPQVEEVLLGPGGVLEGVKPQTILLETSTIDPLGSKRFAQAAAQRGCEMLDCPMSGGTSGAVAGTLTFMVGGKKEIFDRVLPILQAMGKQIFHVGEEVGSGEVVKLCNNLMLGINLLGVCEAFTVGVKAGVPAETLVKVISTSSGNSAVIDRYLPKTILKDQYQPGFMLDLMCKDMRLAVEMAQALKSSVILGSLTSEILDLVQSWGKGKDDFTVVAQLYQDRAGVKIAGKPNA